MSEQQTLPAAPKPKSKQMILRDYLQRDTVKQSIQSVLPKHMTADRLLRVAMQAASRNPVLFECTPESLALSLANAAQLGLEAGGLLGSAYLVPFRNKSGAYEAQLIPGYRGLIDLARRSGEVLKIDARVVRDGDDFEIDYGTDNIRHVPRNPDGDVTGAYAVAALKNGCRQLEYMSRKELDGIRNRSKASNSGPWVSDFEEMCRKTAVRRLAKYIPLSADLARAMEIEDNAESGGSIRDVNDLPALDALPESTETQPEPTTAAEKAKAKLRGRPPKVHEEPVSEPPPDPDSPDACLEVPAQ